MRLVVIGAIFATWGGLCATDVLPSKPYVWAVFVAQVLQVGCGLAAKPDAALRQKDAG